MSSRRDAAVPDMTSTGEPSSDIQWILWTYRTLS
jgi:hypothetical protein